MAEGDEDKTAFIVGEGVFCYLKMPFGLNNARATYQRLIDKIFHDQIERNLEAYVDDMVIKSMYEEEMLADIKETFEKFQSINMKLNPKKCSFGVEEGPFLGHLITKQGIRANPSKGAELNYPGIEKLILALLHAARRLRRYFQEHVIIVLTNSPIKQTLTKPKKSRRVAKWAIELGEHDIVFQERGDKTPKYFLIKVPLEDNKKKAEEKADTKPTKMELSRK
ncbi:reverse transcriptase domain-containing protein [Tanacetum coccineum]